MRQAKKIARQIIDCFKQGNKVICFGNGGSLADCTHWAAEFHGIGPVIALNDPVKITSIGNDYGFKKIFWQQILDLGKSEDLIIGISSSGKSENVNFAFGAAINKGMYWLDFPRKGKNIQEVQEYQYRILHEVYRLVKEHYER